MTYQNDPNRPPRTGLGYGRRADGSISWLPIAIGAAIVVALIAMFWPSRDTTGPRTTETTPRVNTPGPVTPAPTPAPSPQK